MNFETVMQAYNAYRNTPAKTLEARATAINADIAANANADIQAYNIELEAIERIIEERGQTEGGAQVPEGVARTAAGTDKGEDVAGTKEYRSAFFKHLQGRELSAEERKAFDLVNSAERRDSTFNTLSNAAAVIPTTTLDQIMTKARKQGGIMSIARAFSMPSNISIPVATPKGAASWHVEGAEVDAEKTDPARVAFSAYEIMRILSISAATRTMSISAFESYLTDELTASVMACLAAGMVDGTGSGEATGILTGIEWTDAAGATEGDTINKVTIDEALTFSDILAAISLLKRGYSNGAKFVMNNATLYQDVYGLRDKNDNPIYLPDLVNGGPGRILGFDVVFDDYMPDHDIVFGNFGYYGYNLPSGIALDVSRDSSFSKGLIDYRALAVADAKPIVDEAFVRVAMASA